MSSLCLAHDSLMQVVFAIFFSFFSPSLLLLLLLLLTTSRQCLNVPTFLPKAWFPPCKWHGQNMEPTPTSQTLNSRSVSKCQSKLQAILPVSCSIFIRVQIKNRSHQSKIAMTFLNLQRLWTQRVPSTSSPISPSWAQDGYFRKRSNSFWSEHIVNSLSMLNRLKEAERFDCFPEASDAFLGQEFETSPVQLLILGQQFSVHPRLRGTQLLRAELHLLLWFSSSQKGHSS